jgi:hypothetical protein
MLHLSLTKPTIQRGAVAEREERGPKQERRPAKVLEDSILVAAGKKKVRLTAKARIEEVLSIAGSTGLDPAQGHGYEPAPWALWRASMHYAPAKKAVAQFGLRRRRTKGVATPATPTGLLARTCSAGAAA